MSVAKNATVLFIIHSISSSEGSTGMLVILTLKWFREYSVDKLEITTHIRITVLQIKAKHYLLVTIKKRHYKVRFSSV